MPINQSVRQVVIPVMGCGGVQSFRTGLCSRRVKFMEIAFPHYVRYEGETLYIRTEKYGIANFLLIPRFISEDCDKIVRFVKGKEGKFRNCWTLETKLFYRIAYIIFVLFSNIPIYRVL